MNNIFNGVKAFRLLTNGDLQTGGVGGSLETTFQINKTYEVSSDKPIKLCSHGFHFYRQEDACFGYELFGEKTVFHEIIAYGEVIKDTEKCVARKIKIGKRVELKIDGNKNSGDRNSGDRNSGDWNSGNYNSGHRNSGDYNSGSFNSGDFNSGHYNSGYNNSGSHNSGSYNSGNHNSGYKNSGDWNSGNKNSGNFNSGDYNSGNYNSGCYNSGNYNSGHRNSGDYNSGSFNSGCLNSGYKNSGHLNSGDYNSGDFNSGYGYKSKFCTETKYFLFDQEVSKKTYNKINFDMSWFNFTDKTYKEAWAKCPPQVLKTIKELPEFQNEIAIQKFEEITGVKLNIGIRFSPIRTFFRKFFLSIFKEKNVS